MSPNWQSSRDLAVVTLSSFVLASTLIWSATAVAVFFLRRTSAATKHRLWGTSMLAVLVAPLLFDVLPIPRATWPFQQSEPTSVVPFETLPSYSTANEATSKLAAMSAHDLQSDNSVDGITLVAHQSTAASSPIAATPRLPIDSLLTAIVTVWLTGIVIGIVGLAISLRKTWGWLRRTVPIHSGLEIDLCKSLCQELSITLPVRIALSSDASVPFISGLLQPVIVLPSGVGKWSLDRLNVVLSHELLHAKRGDVWWQLIGQICLIPVWFHPLGRYASWRLWTECEHACDDAVLQSGQSACDYASHLVELASELRKRSQRLPAHAVAMARHNPVERRIRSILDPATAREPISRVRAACVVAAMFVAITFIAPLSPGHSEPAPTTTDRADVVAADKNKVTPDATSIPRDNATTALDVNQLAADQASPQADAQRVSRSDDSKPAEGLGGTPESRMLRRVLPSVGNIHTEKKPAGNAVAGQGDRKIQGMGTAIVIDERGYLVTCLHLVADVDSIRVDFVDAKRQKTSYSARTVHVDPVHDLAIIKLDSTNKFPVIHLGTSGNLATGERVIAVGNSFGYINTTTFGYIAGLDRDLQLNESLSYKNLIQTDVAINPGNSGGPLLNIDGEIIGINVAVRANGNRTGFAMPIDDARNWIETMMAAEKKAADDGPSKSAK